MPLKRLPTSNYILATWLGLLLIVLYLVSEERVASFVPPPRVVEFYAPW